MFAFLLTFFKIAVYSDKDIDRDRDIYSFFSAKGKNKSDVEETSERRTELLAPLGTLRTREKEKKKRLNAQLRTRHFPY